MSLTEQLSDHKIDAITDADLDAEIALFDITDPKLLTRGLLNISGYTAAEKELISAAIDVAEQTYKNKPRKLSPTKAILHPYRLAVPLPSEGIPPVEVTVGRILHDLSEEFFGIKPQNFARYGNGVVTFVDAMTKRHGESYPEYIERLAQVDKEHPELMLVLSKSRDMSGNSLDPFALPYTVDRAEKTGHVLKAAHNKYEESVPLLFAHAHEQPKRRTELLVARKRVEKSIARGRRSNKPPYILTW